VHSLPSTTSPAALSRMMATLFLDGFVVRDDDSQ
jgi:hypothetical protein